jgi:hypothetical protein
MGRSQQWLTLLVTAGALLLWQHPVVSHGSTQLQRKSVVMQVHFSTKHHSTGLQR